MQGITPASGDSRAHVTYVYGSVIDEAPVLR
jgi:hypothetical protein